MKKIAPVFLLVIGAFVLGYFSRESISERKPANAAMDLIGQSTSTTLTAPNNAYPREVSSVHVDLRDLVTYVPDMLPHADKIVQSLQRQKSLYGFTTATRVFYMALFDEHQVSGNETLYPLFVFAKTGSHYSINKFNVSVNNEGVVVRANALLSYPLRESRFRVDVG